MVMEIGFNKPYMVGKELWYIAQAHHVGHLASGGQFSKKCEQWLIDNTGARAALLTHSCTGALEMAALLAEIGPGDEVIMPSYTFVSTANAFVLRGATPVFVDIREDTLNLDEALIEDSITSHTRAIVPVHYAGVSCEMEAILSIAEQSRLMVIEDAAQGLMANYKDKALGTFGDMGAVSFHETKNVISGEGGALLVNDEKLIERARIIVEKGTNRHQFIQGMVDKYTWVDIGSSYAPSDLIAAFLYAQMEEAAIITDKRKAIWNRYHDAFKETEERGLLRRPVIPNDREHNAHMYYLILPDAEKRDRLISGLRERGIQSVFHYVPLHNSPAGGKYGKSPRGGLPITDKVSSRLVRLPLWVGMEDQQDYIVECVNKLVGLF